MQSVRVEQAHLDWALAKAKREPKYKNSHRGADAAMVGFIGEAIFADYLTSSGVEFVVDNKTTHDLTLIGNGRLEIKTKDRTVEPQPHFDCSLPAYNHDHQNASYFGFVSLQRSPGVDGWERYHTAHIVGAANQEMIQVFGVRWEAGQTDPANGTKFWTACINITIENLMPIEDAVVVWRSRQIR